VSEIFHFPPIAFFFFFFLLLLHLSAAFICYPFPTVGLDFLPDRDDQNEDAKTKAPKETVERKRPNNVDRKKKFTTRNFLSSLASR
jgi:hypothetical protein